VAHQPPAHPKRRRCYNQRASKEAITNSAFCGTTFSCQPDFLKTQGDNLHPLVVVLLWSCWVFSLDLLETALASTRPTLLPEGASAISITFAGILVVSGVLYGGILVFKDQVLTSSGHPSNH
jgi:hypothetical protein